MSILVAGSIVYDTVLGPVSALEWETTKWVPHFTSGVGGNGASTAYAAARLGASVTLMGVCGSDPTAAVLLEALHSAGVNTSQVARLSGVTAATVGIFHPDGRRSLLHTPGVGAQAEFSFQPGYRHLHIANPFALPALRRGGFEMLAQARAAGMTTSLDTGWDRLSEWMQVLRPCLPYLDILFANEAEMQQLEGPFPCHTVIKRGALGCTVDGEPVPGYRVQALDTTGAGDCFCGGFLAARARGATLREAARVANAAGALSVQHAGATPGLLDWNATREWMALQVASS